MALAAGIPGVDAAAEPQANAAPAGATWQQHDYSFAFMGFTSIYSCDGLADKLQALLLASGARADSRARAGACAGGFGRPDHLARAELTFYTLSPAGPSAPDSTSDIPAKGAARWAPVAIARRRPPSLDLGDCELVAQFRDQVLPLFTVRGIKDHTSCVPHQLSGSVIDLKYETFSAPRAP